MFPFFLALRINVQFSLARATFSYRPVIIFYRLYTTIQAVAKEKFELHGIYKIIN